jgi:hypothetical protein
MKPTPCPANEIVNRAVKKIPPDFITVNSQVDKPLITSKFTIPLTTYNENSTPHTPTGGTRRDVQSEKTLETLKILQWRCSALADLLTALTPQIEQLAKSIQRDADRST